MNIIPRTERYREQAHGVAFQGLCGPCAKQYFLGNKYKYLITVISASVQAVFDVRNRSWTQDF